MQSYSHLDENTRAQLNERNKKLRAKQAMEMLSDILNTLNKFFSIYPLPQPKDDIYGSQELTNRYHAAIIEFQDLVPEIIKKIEILVLDKQQENELAESLKIIYLVLSNISSELERVLDPTESRDAEKRAHNADVINKMQYIHKKLQAILNEAHKDDHVNEATSTLATVSPNYSEEEALSASDTMGVLSSMLPNETLEEVFSFLDPQAIVNLRLASKGSYENTLHYMLDIIHQMPVVKARKLIERLFDDNRFVNNLGLKSTPLGIVLHALSTHDVATINLAELEQAVNSPDVKRYPRFYESARLSLALLNPSDTTNDIIDRIRKVDYCLLVHCSSDEVLTKARLKKFHEYHDRIPFVIKQGDKQFFYGFTGETWKLTELETPIQLTNAFVKLDNYNTSNYDRPSMSKLLKALQDEIKSKKLHTYYYDESLIINVPRANLHEITLCHANLQGAVFDGANVDDVNMSCARLHDASFNGATLSGGTTLYLASLKNVDFSFSELKNVSFERAKFDEVNFSGANLFQCNMKYINMHLKNVNLSNATIDLSLSKTQHRSALKYYSIIVDNTHFYHSSRCYIQILDKFPTLDRFSSYNARNRLNWMYLISQGYLYYIDMEAADSIRVRVSKETVALLQDALKPTSEMRLLSENELKQITPMTGHIHSSDTIESTWINFSVLDMSKMILNKVKFIDFSVINYRNYRYSHHGVISSEDFIEPHRLEARLDNLACVRIEGGEQALDNFQDAIAYELYCKSLDLIMARGKFITENLMEKLECLIACLDVAIEHPLLKGGYFKANVMRAIATNDRFNPDITRYALIKDGVLHDLRSECEQKLRELKGLEKTSPDIQAVTDQSARSMGLFSGNSNNPKDTNEGDEKGSKPFRSI
jgi:uncharacterized protein YjbI with pentapeptide repeats